MAEEHCSNCGASNADSQKLCGGCGTALTMVASSVTPTCQGRSSVANAATSSGPASSSNVAAFTALVELCRDGFVVDRVQEARPVFATEMGPEVPEARQGAQTADTEIAGADHLLEVWKDALAPPIAKATG